MVFMGKKLFPKQVHTLVKPVIYSLILFLVFSVTSQLWGPYYSKSVANIAIAIGSDNVSGEFNGDLLELTIKPEDPAKQWSKIQQMSVEKIAEIGLPVSQDSRKAINYNSEIEIRPVSIWLILYITLIPVVLKSNSSIPFPEYVAFGVICMTLNLVLILSIIASLEIVVSNPAYLTTWDQVANPLTPLLNLLPCALLIGYFVVKVKATVNN